MQNLTLNAGARMEPLPHLKLEMSLSGNTTEMDCASTSYMTNVDHDFTLIGDFRVERKACEKDPARTACVTEPHQ